VYNGVDLEEFSPGGTEVRPSDRVRLLIVEGRLDGGYELGLDHALSLSRHLQKKIDLPLELLIVGQASERLRQEYAGDVGVILNWAGVISPEGIPSMDRSAHALFSADIHPACPNSVIEALAVGLPVIAFATGALPEMIQGDSGRIVPYGSDPWKLEDPNFSSLADAAIEIFQDQERFRLGARAHAVDAFGIERTVQGYLSALEWV
jgi:glycosyltransferase involved in cell wall biosynthesis